MNKYFGEIKRVRPEKKTPKYILKFQEYLNEIDRTPKTNTVTQRICHITQFDEWLRIAPSFKGRNNGKWAQVCRTGRAFFINQKDLRDYFKYLFNQDQMLNTRLAKRSSLQEFYKYTRTKELMSFFPDWTIIPMRKSREEEKEKSKYRLTKEDVQNIRDYIARQDTLPSLKKSQNRIVLECLATFGVRCNELIRIRANKINFDKGYVEVFGYKTAHKSKGWRLIPMHGNVASLIHDYISLYKHTKQVRSMQYLLPPLENPNSNEYISITRVKWLVQVWYEALNIPDLTPHQFRHYFITSMYEVEDESGHKIYAIEQVADMAGCEPETIQKAYYHPSEKKLLESYHFNGVEL